MGELLLSICLGTCLIIVGILYKKLLKNECNRLKNKE